MSFSKTIKGAALAASALLACEAMAAQPIPGIYIGVGLLDANVEFDGTSSDAEPTALFARGGYQFNDYLAAEARLGTGIDEDEIRGVEIDIDNFLGIYAKVGMPTTVGFYPYVIAGFTSTEVEASYRGSSETEDETDVSLGLGVEYQFDRNFSLGLEYMQYVDGDDYELSGLSIGGNYKF